MWGGGDCPYPYPYPCWILAGFFVGLTAFLAGLLAFVLIGIKELITRSWVLILS